MNRFEELYYVAKADKWFKRFAIFCRIALAASFIPSGYVKIMGERFTGLSSNKVAKILRHAKFSVTAFIIRANRWTVV